MDFRVVIPARYASSRLPGKPLADIHGKAMVLHVVERALQSGAQTVIVATDDVRVCEAVSAAGHQAIMTSPNHASGTERLIEVVDTLGWADDTLVVNVQGDEPLLDPQCIRAVVERLASQPGAAMATLAHPISNQADLMNPNVVKVVSDALGHAMYFSRAPIPWPRDAMAAGRPVPPATPMLRHIGLYAYRAGFLKIYGKLAPSPLEDCEMLEQLRVLWHGYRISLGITPAAVAPGVDTPEDLARVRALFASM